jgi:hypothetical protein
MRSGMKDRAEWRASKKGWKTQKRNVGFNGENDDEPITNQKAIGF